MLYYGLESVCKRMLWGVVILLFLLGSPLCFSQEQKGLDTMIPVISVVGEDVDSFLSLLADFSGLSFSKTKEVQGKVTTDLKDVTVRTVLDLVLKGNGWNYDVTDEGIVLVMTQEQYKALKDRPQPKVTKEYTAKYVPLEDLVNAFRPLLSPQGKITPVKSANKVIVVDVSEVIAKIQDIYPLVDSLLMTRVFPLEYISVDEIQRQIEQLVEPQRGALQVDKQRNLLIIKTTQEKMEQVAKLIEEFDKKLEIEVFDIQFAEVEEVAKLIKPLLNKEGYMEVYELNNQIIIQDIPTLVDQVRDLISKIDIPPLAVYLEAEIVNLNLDKVFELGVNWDFGRHVTAGPVVASGTESTLEKLDDGNIRDSLFRLASGNFTYLDFTTWGDYGLSVTLNALESKGITQILAQPRVLVMHDKEAEFNVGSEEPFLVRQRRIGTGVDSDTEYFTQRTRQVGITLEVVPRLIRSGYVELEVFLEDSSARRVQLRNDEALAVDQRKTDTTVIVKDGRTVVIGGLITRTQRENKSGVPVLSQLPVVGAAFRNRNTEDKRQKLLLFLTPHIVNVEDPYQKYQFDDSMKVRMLEKDGVWEWQDKKFEDSENPESWIQTVPPEERKYLPKEEQPKTPLIMPGGYDEDGTFWTPGILPKEELTPEERARLEAEGA